MTEEQLKNNKELYLTKLNSIKRDGADIDGLINYLEKSDFFSAPATTNAFRAYEGGLCEQALDTLTELNIICEKSSYTGASEDNKLIVALCAGFGKIGYFESSVINKKVYKPGGLKQDELGRFDWESERGWKVKDPKERFVYGTSGQNAERIASMFIPLTIEESAAILHLHDDYENPNFNLASIYFNYPLAVLLNAADKFAAFINTRDDAIPF